MTDRAHPAPARAAARRAGGMAVVLGSLALFLVLLAALAGRVRAGEDPALGPATPVPDVAQRRVIVRRVVLRRIIITDPAPRPRRRPVAAAPSGAPAVSSPPPAAVAPAPAPVAAAAPARPAPARPAPAPAAPAPVTTGTS
ncbi:MAG: hypothetical protein QOC68_2339 [Solirubrobacteraceae bacterium]|jgi:hypothetical protein|nr:hypothetical protein [Solirubrobacteraceae bacterium]